MKYPYYGKSEFDEMIVCFSSWGTGVVVEKGNYTGPNGVGYSSSGWVMDLFEETDYKEKKVKTMKKEAKHYRVVDDLSCLISDSRIYEFATEKEALSLAKKKVEEEIEGTEYYVVKTVKIVKRGKIPVSVKTIK